MPKIQALLTIIKRMRMIDKWLLKLTNSKQIRTELDDFRSDVASIKSISPRIYLNHISIKIEQMQEETNGSMGSIFKRRTAEVLSECTLKLNDLLSHLDKAERTAQFFTTTCERITEEMTQWRPKSPESTTGFSPRDKLGHIFRCNSQFDTLRTAGASVWAAIRSSHEGYLDDITPDFFGKIDHNALAFLLLTNEETFIDAVNEGILPIEGEIGHLILQRLKEIYFTTALNNSPGKVASSRKLNVIGSIISRTMTRFGDGIIKCDFEILNIELTKLVLHAELHPEAKVFWLGTSRTVMAVIRSNRGIGTYLNCDDAKWTWHLNRIWLQAAMILGYQCELVEQHFPNIQKAIFSQDGGANFVEELLKSVRNKGSDQTSQYDGYDAPTATTQEILVLMDMGCVASKNSLNNRVCFSKPITRETPSPAPLNAQTSPIRFFQRKSLSQQSLSSMSHSWDPGCNASVPPLGASREQFFAPIKTSEQIRSEQNTATSISLRIVSGIQ